MEKVKAEAIMLKPTDNVVTVVEGAAKGSIIHYYNGGELMELELTEDIPPCHKAALCDIKKGEHIIKYGESIGGALVDISCGGWVSHLNIESLPRDYDSQIN